jgi:AraC-like DNA-binding protein
MSEGVATETPGTGPGVRFLARHGPGLATSPATAASLARKAFPDLREFRFTRTDDLYLRSARTLIDGVRLGFVQSAGHRIRLSDEAHVALLVPLDGAVRVAIDRHEASTGPGGLIAVWPGERETTLAADYRGVVAQVPVTLLCGLAMTPGVTALLLGGGVPGQGCERGAAAIAALRRHVLSLLDLLDGSDRLTEVPGLARAAARWLAELVVDLASLVAPNGSGGGGDAIPGLWAIGRAEAFMRAHVGAPITIGDVAASVGVGVRALQSGFRRHRGTTPSAFLTARRLELVRARLLTASPADTVTSVMLECGFGHAGRFAALYRYHYGERPSVTLARRRALG